MSISNWTNQFTDLHFKREWTPEETAKFEAAREEFSEIIAESRLSKSATINLWSPSRIKKYLRKYDLGKGSTEFGIAKHRYKKTDVALARKELLAAEPKKPDGSYVNPNLNFLQGEHSL